MQTVTLTHGLLEYDPLEQSEPFTVMDITLTGLLFTAVTVRVAGFTVRMAAANPSLCAKGLSMARTGSR